MTRNKFDRLILDSNAMKIVSVEKAVVCAALLGVLGCGVTELNELEMDAEDIPSLVSAEINVEPFLTSTGVRFVAKDCYPSFSWDTVPVYMMFANRERVLNDKEVKKIASETSFICIEKNHAFGPLGDAALGLEHETRAFKAVNSEIKVLGYFNAALCYSFTRYTEMLSKKNIYQHPEIKAYLMIDPKTGELLKHNGLYCLNTLNSEMRNWWSDAGVAIVRESGASGIFIDQMHGFYWLHAKEDKLTVADGLRDMMQQLKDKIGPDKILLANNGANIEAIFEIADAFMFEHYELEVTHSKERLLKDWKLMEKIADAGKICVYRFGANHAFNAPKKKRDLAEWSKKKLEFHLALYLIGAQPYSYFQWGWGWKLDTGPLEDYPELQRPLGKPLGKYARVDPKNWEFTRDFEHARVWVDTDKREAKIEWE